MQNVLPFSPNRAFDYGDFTMYRDKMFHLTTAKALATGLPLYNYPAPAAFVYSAMFHLRRPLTVYKVSLLFMAALFVGIALYAVLRERDRRSLLGVTFRSVCAATILLTTFCSYPILFAAIRGNLEGIALMLFAGGVLLFVLNRNTGAAVFWGLGMAIKPFPALLFLLLVRRRKFGSIAIGLACSAAIQALALYRLGPTIPQAARDLASGFDLYKKTYIFAYRPSESRFQHSIFDAMRGIQHGFYPENTAGTSVGVVFNSGNVQHLYTYYLVVAALVATACLIRFWRLPVLNQLFAIILLVLLLPPVSADYTTGLLHLPFLIWFVWLRRIAEGDEEFTSVPWLIGLSVCFGILFSAQNWFRGATGVFHSAVLLCLLVLVSALPMRLPSLDRTPNEPLPVG